MEYKVGELLKVVAAKENYMFSVGDIHVITQICGADIYTKPLVPNPQMGES